MTTASLKSGVGVEDVHDVRHHRAIHLRIAPAGCVGGVDPLALTTFWTIQGQWSANANGLASVCRVWSFSTGRLEQCSEMGWRRLPPLLCSYAATRTSFDKQPCKL